VGHGRFVPFGFAETPPFEHSSDDVVTVLKNVGLDCEIVAHDPLDHVAAAIHQRLQILNNGGGKGPEHGAINQLISLAAKGESDQFAK
jgi:hypothetical protein